MYSTLRKLLVSLPASLLMLSTGAVAFGLIALPDSIAKAMGQGLGWLWVAFLFIGCLALTVGPWLRPTEQVSQQAVVALACELLGAGLAGGMFITYAGALTSKFGLGLLGPPFLSTMFMLALGLLVLGVGTSRLLDHLCAYRKAVLGA